MAGDEAGKLRESNADVDAAGLSLLHALSASTMKIEAYAERFISYPYILGERWAGNIILTGPTPSLSDLKIFR